MDKLSLYEILSFVIPGYISINIIAYYNNEVYCSSSFYDSGGKIEDSIFLFCLSLFLGIIIHVVTFRFLKTSKLKWYKKLIFKSVQEISADNDFIQKVIPFLNSDYVVTRKHNENPVESNQAENNLFDFAYLYLEVNDKITPAKNFQSMYFWFRNMFTICIVMLPISIGIYISTFCLDMSKEQKTNAFLAIIVTIVTGFIIIPIANWLREKLIEKVLWSYYVERVHKEDK